MTFLTPILPEFILFCSALLILVADIYFAKNRQDFFRFTYLAALLACFLTLFFISQNDFATATFYNRMFFTNSFTCFVKFVSVILLIFVIILSLNFIANNKEISAEFIALMMISTVGSMFLISSNDFMTFYLALELQSLPLYLLAAMNKKSARSAESGVKYFILGSTASGLLLLGISLFYGFSGTTNFDAAFHIYQQHPVPPAVVLGFILILIAMFFKISAAPFHMWTPDVYQGASSVVTTFFATSAKFSAALIFVRLFLDVSTGFVGIEQVLILVALTSLTVGSLGAIMQRNIKRLLAYSSIGHIGFVILGLSAISLEGIKSCVIYMTIYAFLSIGTFGFLNLIFGIKNSKNAGEDDISDEKIFNISSFKGLAKTNPFLAAIFTILMFSTAGIPPMAGFFAKFYVISAIVKSGYITTAIIAILFSVISAFYYLRIVKIMYFEPANQDSLKFINRLNPKIVVGAMASFNLLFIGFMKQFIAMINTMVGF